MLKLLEECCDGKNIHEVAQVRTGLNLQLGALGGEPLNPQHMAIAKRAMKDLGARARRLHRQWRLIRGLEDLGNG